MSEVLDVFSWSKETEWAWFKACPGCAGARPPTIWCQECESGYCEKDFAERHGVGDYVNHKKTAGLISRQLKIGCSDCGQAFALTSLIFCQDCDSFLCSSCDKYAHPGTQEVVHERQRYEVEPGGWIFSCSGCTPEQRALVEPTLWCYDCNQAYCEEHCRERHLTGKFRKHESQIQPIGPKLKLPCSDCKDVFAVVSMEYCQDCEAMFCKVCSRYKHTDLTGSDRHRLRPYYQKGRVRVVPENQGTRSLSIFKCLSDTLCQKDLQVPRPSVEHRPSSSSRTSMLQRFLEGSENAWNGLTTALNTPKSSASNEPPSFQVTHSAPEEETPDPENPDTQPTGPPVMSMELQVFLELIREGVEVTRFSRSGEQKRVLLVLAPGDEEFVYAPTKPSFSVKDPGERRLPVGCLVEVRAGTDPDPEFPEFGGTCVLRQGCKPTRANRALSLVGEFPPREGEEDGGPRQVTWDFEFTDAKDMRAALGGLRRLLAHVRAQAAWEALLEEAEGGEGGGEEEAKDEDPEAAAAPSNGRASLGSGVGAALSAPPSKRGSQVVA